MGSGGESLTHGAHTALITTRGKNKLWETYRNTSGITGKMRGDRGGSGRRGKHSFQNSSHFPLRVFVTSEGFRSWIITNERPLNGR